MNVSSTFAANDGDGYELVMGRWSRRLAVPFLDFAGTCYGERVLDVGCGTGHLAQAIVERSMPREVRAIDFAPAYIDYARSRNRDARVVFDVGDACAMEFAPMFWPTINSYKRLVDGFWAPVKPTWGLDNRTASFRVIAGSPKATRLETRCPGADINPYLAAAALIARAVRPVMNT